MRSRQNRGPARLRKEVAPQRVVQNMDPPLESQTQGGYRDGQVNAARGLLKEATLSAWPGPRSKMGIYGPSVELEKVWQVRRYEKPFEDFCDGLQEAAIDQNRLRLFHGTKVASLVGILLRGLVPGRSGHLMFGQGIYFGPFEKAVSYGGNYFSGYSKYFIFAAEVALGKTKLLEKADHDLGGEKIWSEGYHSVAAKRGLTNTWGDRTLLHDEYVVYGWNQVRLLYLAQFKAKKF